MLFIAEFGKHADKPQEFRAALDPHLEYLKVEKNKILLSATKHDPTSNEVQGFVWIIEAEDAEAAEALCQRDPFWIAGLRTSFSLSSLTKALPDQKALI